MCYYYDKLTNVIDKLVEKLNDQGGKLERTHEMIDNQNDTLRPFSKQVDDRNDQLQRFKCNQNNKFTKLEDGI